MTLHPFPEPGLPRRAFLKHAGLAAAGAVAVGRAVESAAWAADGDADTQGASAFAAGGRSNFRLMIDGAPPVLLASIESVAIDDLTVDARETTTGHDVEYRTYAPGDAHYGKLTLRARVGSDSKDLSQWWQDCSKGTNVRKSISVICLKRDGSEARRFNLFECFPVSFAPGEFSGDGGRAIERLELMIGRIEMAAVGDTPTTPNARFEVAIADPAGAVARPAVASPLATAAAVEVDRGWENLAGGALVLDVTDPALGCEAFHTTTPGHKYIDEIVLRGPMTAGRKALCTWINETVKGKPWKRTLTVKEILKDGSAGKTFIYHDCFPTRYVFPKLAADGTGNLYEEVTIKPTRLTVA